MTDSSEQPTPEQAIQNPALSPGHQARLRLLFRLIDSQPEGHYLFDLMCRYRENQSHA